MRFVVTVILIGICAIAWSSTALAVQVTNGGTVLFSDDFEGVAAGLAPVADVGTWVTSAQALVGDDDPPAAYQGSNYLNLGRPGLADAVFTALQTSGEVHAEITVNQPMWPGSSNGAYLTLAEGGTIRIFVLLHADGVWVHNGSGWSKPGLVWTVDEWEKYTIDYVPGAATFDLTFEGTKVAGLSVMAAGNVDRIHLDGGGDSISYFDAVPEPSMVVMGLIGLFSLLVVRPRR